MVNISEIDTKRFGIKIAKANIEDSSQIASIFQNALALSTKLLILRCSTQNIEIAQELEKNECSICDTLLYYRKKVTENQPLLSPSEYEVVPCDFTDAEKIKEVATAAFANYMGHYHADSRLSLRSCNEVYIDWAINRTKEIPFFGVRVKNKSSIIGFISGQLDKTASIIDVPLLAVVPEFQGRGIFTKLMVKMENWALQNSYKTIVYSTQLQNISVQKSLVRNGFELQKSLYTFHRWF
jgi:GNAT superfamily N-acetyltransferase